MSHCDLLSNWVFPLHTSGLFLFSICLRALHHRKLVVSLVNCLSNDTPLHAFRWTVAGMATMVTRTALSRPCRSWTAMATSVPTPWSPWILPVEVGGRLWTLACPWPLWLMSYPLSPVDLSILIWTSSCLWKCDISGNCMQVRFRLKFRITFLPNTDREGGLHQIRFRLQFKNTFFILQWEEAGGDI